MKNTRITKRGKKRSMMMVVMGRIKNDYRNAAFAAPDDGVDDDDDDDDNIHKDDHLNNGC